MQLFSENLPKDSRHTEKYTQINFHKLSGSKELAPRWNSSITCIMGLEEIGLIHTPSELDVKKLNWRPHGVCW